MNLQLVLLRPKVELESLKTFSERNLEARVCLGGFDLADCKLLKLFEISLFVKLRAFEWGEFERKSFLILFLL